MPINLKNYHPKWSLISYLVIKVRANDHCEWCGAKNGEPNPITGSKVVLTTAHLDQNRRNNRFYNLAALCQRCHLGHDRKMHAYSRRYGRETQYVNAKLFFKCVFRIVPLFFTNFIIHRNHTPWHLEN